MASTWLLLERSPDGRRAPHVARLESVGRCLPATRRTTSEVMASTRHRTKIDLEQLTGIRERRIADGGQDSLTLAAGAAADCLGRSRHRPEDLEAVVSCSITKYRDGLVQWIEPPTSVAVARAIGATRAVTFDVSNACAGMLTGVFILANRIRRGELRCGMVVSGECISQLGVNAAAHVRTVLSPELASLTLGDAGAAVILERAPRGGPGIEVAGFTTVSRHSRLCLAFPARRARGARMFTRSRAIHRAAVADMPLLLGEALGAAGLTIADVDFVIPHQTSVRAIRSGMGRVCEALGDTPRHHAVVTVDRYGNTASTTHFVALAEELEAGRVRAGDRVALVALASGLEIGLVLFTVDEELAGTYGNHR
ncbi:MAG TPA: 3-oxoacyl-[acyl-carrier-protein] synthase III C-terminal domain-containing protein [Actinomycetota bacterium]|jgi:3-oxoacyl-[acyl-carrier-protein] synthase-3|nr:3-oxoacyl-[acyl-carrier-protein] synthase III C-terminal domain-containing protein [Actinomycetota bacterium]